jgi:hypothetical protein
MSAIVGLADRERLSNIMKKCVETKRNTDAVMRNMPCDTKRIVDNYITDLERNDIWYRTDTIGQYRFRVDDTHAHRSTMEHIRWSVMEDICAPKESKFEQICMPQFVAELKARGFVVESHRYDTPSRKGFFTLRIPFPS